MYRKRTSSDVELKVCALLLTLPKMPNVVEIYEVNVEMETVVMEQLDFNYNYQSLSVADRSRVIYIWSATIEL